MKKMEMSGLTLAASLALALGTATAGAQTPSKSDYGAQSTSATTQKTESKTTEKSMTMDKSGKSADASFIKKAADAGMMEVDMGRVGTDKAASSEVKTFAQRMVDDHGKANDELKNLASSKNVELPTDMKGQKIADKYQGKAGTDFDKAFMKQMVADHKKVVKEFEREAKNGKDPDVKAWAEKTLPGLRDHLSEAENLYNNVKNNSATTTEPKGAKTPTKKSGS